MGVTLSSNTYTQIDNSAYDIEFELAERIKSFEGLTLDECIEKRFPNRKFKIRCFKTSEEIETKQFAKLNKITFSGIYINNKKQDVVVTRRPTQTYIRFCDVIDALITYGNDNDVYDLIYYGKLKVKDTQSNQNKLVPYYETRIISTQSQYSELCNEPNTTCIACNEPTYLNNSISDRLSFVINCEFRHSYTNTLKANLEYYCDTCFKGKKIEDMLKPLQNEFDQIVRAKRVRCRTHGCSHSSSNHNTYMGIGAGFGGGSVEGSVADSVAVEDLVEGVVVDSKFNT